MKNCIETPLEVSQFDYDLPDSLIAEYPVERGRARMMVINRAKGTITHHSFSEITDYVNKDFRIVTNNTRVIPARIFAYRVSGGQIEILLVKEENPFVWEVLAKDLKRLHVGEILTCSSGNIRILEKRVDTCLVQFENCGADLLKFLEAYGDTPLPPYILKKRGEKRSREQDIEDYQTVFASVPGSIAAPTAGLHFTTDIIERAEKKTGAPFITVTLDVGPGTFKPVKVNIITDHRMHEERFTISEENKLLLNSALSTRKIILAVGTTTVRALESAVDNKGYIQSGDQATSIFIYPGYQFKVTGALLTNFHLPRSTLLMLVSAFAGYDIIKEAYRKAVEEKYRFFSYGDCMLII